MQLNIKPLAEIVVMSFDFIPTICIAAPPNTFL
jgi:hypothetical protein